MTDPAPIAATSLPVPPAADSATSSPATSPPTTSATGTNPPTSLLVGKEAPLLILVGIITVVAAAILSATSNPIPSWFETLAIGSVLGGAGLAVPNRSSP